MALITKELAISTYLSDDDAQYVWELARKAGHIASMMRHNVVVTEKSGPHDLVTEADLQLSKLIVDALRQRFAKDVIISEEGAHPTQCRTEDRIWLVDPIDGTDNYIRNDGQYAVMIGLLIAMKPIFGWVYAPASDQSYFGGPGSGSWHQVGAQPAVRFGSVQSMGNSQSVRVMMGFRDRKDHPWVNELSGIEWIKSGSVGLKVGKILANQADMFIHLSGKLKVWDTAAPIAIALGAGLEVSQIDGNEIGFPLPRIEHYSTVVIGRPGCLSWSRQRIVKPGCQME